ncbi:MAG: hypothetical protein H6706_08080 [Myxococcales bacterium]|nr:hypothetical protein [Myxococcales bacterium]
MRGCWLLAAVLLGCDPGGDGPSGDLDGGLADGAAMDSGGGAGGAAGGAGGVGGGGGQGGSADAGPDAGADAGGMAGAGHRLLRAVVRYDGQGEAGAVGGVLRVRFAATGSGFQVRGNIQ